MLNALQKKLYEINPFVHAFMSTGDQAKGVTNISNMNLFIHNTHGKDMRQYNQLTVSEIAAIIFDDYNYIPESRDIIIRSYKD